MSSDPFLEYLAKAKKIVASWPEWKKRSLGAIGEPLKESVMKPNPIKPKYTITCPEGWCPGWNRIVVKDARGESVSEDFFDLIENSFTVGEDLVCADCCFFVRSSDPDMTFEEWVAELLEDYSKYLEAAYGEFYDFVAG